MVNKLISSQATDGGKSRIPILTYKMVDGERKANTNGEKGKALANSFFSVKPTQALRDISDDHEPCCTADPISKEQLDRQL
jgi:hypothetical protein